jgi:hypothetical protein
MISRAEIMEARAEYIKNHGAIVEKAADDFATKYFETIKDVGSVDVENNDNTGNEPDDIIRDYYEGASVDRNLVVKAFGRLGLYVEDFKTYFTIGFKP